MSASLGPGPGEGFELGFPADEGDVDIRNGESADRFWSRRCDLLLSQHGDMQITCLGGRICAELGREYGPQPVKRNQRGCRLARSLMSPHQRPAGRLVERVGEQRGLGDVAGDRRLTRAQCGLRGDQADPPEQPGRGDPGRLGPIRIGLVVEQPPATQQVERPARGRHRQRRGTVQAGLRLGTEPLGLVDTSTRRPAVSPRAYPPRPPRMTAGPSTRRSLLTRVATLSAERTGGFSVQSTPTIRSIGTDRPRSTTRSSSSRRAFRLPTSMSSSGRPPSETPNLPTRRNATSVTVAAGGTQASHRRACSLIRASPSTFNPAGPIADPSGALGYTSW